MHVEVETWRGAPELVVTLVNESPERTRTHPDTHLYEASLAIHALLTAPFDLEALPETFRYDRQVPAYGINAGVEVLADGLRTTDAVLVDRGRPSYAFDAEPPPDLSFAALADDPLPQIDRLIDALDRWGGQKLVG